MSVKVITISGRARAGKDTTAQFLKEELESKGQRVLIAHYADLLKYICKTFFNWDGEKDEQGRALLQNIGTDVIRAKKPNFWVDFLADIISLFQDRWDYVLIPDTRFPNEITGMKSRGFITTHLRVERPNFRSELTTLQMTHLSEIALDDTEPDYTIINDGSLEQLKGKVKDYVENEFHGLQITEDIISD